MVAKRKSPKHSNAANDEGETIAHLVMPSVMTKEQEQYLEMFKKAVKESGIQGYVYQNGKHKKI